MKETLEKVIAYLEGERVAEAFARLRKTYALEETDRPPVVQMDWTGWLGYSCKEMAEDPAKNLELRLVLAERSLAIGSDYTPMIDLSEPYGTVMVPDAFDCPISWRGDDPPWSDPIITDAQQVYSLKKPRVRESKMIQDIRKHVEWGQREAGGRLPMLLIDLQSPYSVACQIWDWETLMTACFAQPDAVHLFLRMVTEFSIEFMQEYMTWIEQPLHPGRNFPSIRDDIGINIADDTAVIMLSPEQYEEFALPYNVQIAEAFNGLSIHSCGDYNHQLDNLMKIPGLKAIQCHMGPGEMPAEPLVDKVNGKVAVWVDWNDLARGPYPDAQTLQQEYTLPYLRRFERGLIAQGPGGKDSEEIRENYLWLVEQLR